MAGQAVGVIEATEMQNVPRASRSGVVKAARFGSGAVVDGDALTIEFEPAEAAAAADAA